MPGPDAHQVQPPVIDSQRMLVEPAVATIEEAKVNALNEMMDQVERQSHRSAGQQTLFSQPSGGRSSQGYPKPVKADLVSKMTNHVIDAIKVNNVLPKLTFKEDVAK
jgi:hypothetical protein